MKKLLMAGMIAVTLVSCGNHKYVAGEKCDGNTWRSKVENNYPVQTLPANPPVRVALPQMGGDTNFLPNATAFRMNGNYANNVAITLGPDGNLLYFPAPTDISADSEPLDLGNGWWLNRQGLGPNSVFTKYTFAEYAALPETPSLEQLKLSVIPGARVAGFMELPVKIGDAENNLDALKDFVKDR